MTMICHVQARANTVSEPRERSSPAKRRARERAEESEGQRRSDDHEGTVLQAFRQGRFLA